MSPSNEANETFSNNDDDDVPIVVVNEQVADKELKGNEEAAVEEVAKSITKVKDIPKMAEYFKMLRLGVPPNAVKLKMSRENINPDLLDDPEAEAPGSFNATEI